MRFDHRRRRWLESVTGAAVEDVAAVNSITARRLISGFPRQVFQIWVMWQNMRCSILFHFEVRRIATDLQGQPCLMASFCDSNSPSTS